MDPDPVFIRLLLAHILGIDVEDVDAEMARIRESVQCESD